MKSSILSEKLLLIALSLCTLAGCSDNDPDFYRSSDGLATEKMSLYVEAQVHTHYDEHEQPEETHTTVVVEFYGFDRKGYYYMVELAEGDTISAGTNSELQTLEPRYFPQQGERLSVLYYRDFPTIEGNAVFDVVLDRNTDADLHTASVTLPTLAEFTIEPQEPSVTLGEPMTLNWPEEDDQRYALLFTLSCATDGETAYRSHVRFPNHQVQTLAPPFAFQPSDYFNGDAVEDYTDCQLRSTLKTWRDQAPTEDHPFDALELRSTREQNILRVITTE